MKLRVLPVFSISFAVVYALALFFRIRVLVYYPKVEHWSLTVDPTLPAPAMFYYGWLTIALVGSTVVSLFALMLRKRSMERISSSWTWVVPVIAIAFVTVIHYFRFGF